MGSQRAHSICTKRTRVNVSKKEGDPTSCLGSMHDSFSKDAIRYGTSLVNCSLQ